MMALSRFYSITVLNLFYSIKDFLEIDTPHNCIFLTNLPIILVNIIINLSLLLVTYELFYELFEVE